MVKREARDEKMYIQLHNGVGYIPHFHEAMEFVLLLEGSVDAYAEEQRYELRTGDAFLTFPHQVHSYDRDSPDERAWLVVAPVSMCDIFKSLLYQYQPKSNRIPAEQVAPEVHTLLEKIYAVHGPHSEILRKAFWSAVLGLLLQNMTLEKTVSGQRDFLRHVLEYCTENLNESLKLDAVAKGTGISKHHISHMFQKTLGIGFHDYVNTLRVNEAARLLRETDQSITEISFQAGFSSLRTFNRVFQEQMDCSPRDYRSIVESSFSPMPGHKKPS